MGKSAHIKSSPHKHAWGAFYAGHLATAEEAILGTIIIFREFIFIEIMRKGLMERGRFISSVCRGWIGGN
jgi:hypothetical protein